MLHQVLQVFDVKEMLQVFDVTGGVTGV